ncbi:MAG TPA: alpha/beta fold hydrolase [Gemmatimonadaceae bacterium]|nr:alpha/beta fold hydrolase [Gemmatimonadaceae bacterium]
MKIRMLPALAAMAAAPLAAQAPAASSAGETGNSGATRAPKFGNARLRTGVRLHYAQQGAARGEPLILLHGLADSWFSFSRVMPLLPGSYRVFALDQRGHGESDRPASGYTIADFAEDVVAFLDAMEIPRATLVGHSMGAFVAQRVAIIAPDRVHRLVLIGGAPSARNEVLLGLQQELAPLPPSMPTEFLQAFQYGTVHAPVPKPFMDAVIAESAKVPTRVARSALDGLLASGDSSRLADIRLPALLVWGEHDAIFDAPSRAALREALASEEHRLYPEAGHAPHWEVPELFTRDLLGFLGRTGTR